MVADTMGYSWQKVIAVEQGQSDFSYQELEVVAVFLKIPLEVLVSPELFINTDEKYRIPPPPSAVEK